MIVQHALPLCALNPRPTICRYFASDSVGLAICINSTSGQSNPSENKSTLTSTCTRQSQPSCVKQSQPSRAAAPKSPAAPSRAAAPSAHKQSQLCCFKQSQLCCVGNSRATPQGANSRASESKASSSLECSAERSRKSTKLKLVCEYRTAGLPVKSSPSEKGGI